MHDKEPTQEIINGIRFNAFYTILFTKSTELRSNDNQSLQVYTTLFKCATKINAKCVLIGDTILIHYRKLDIFVYKIEIKSIEAIEMFPWFIRKCWRRTFFEIHPKIWYQIRQFPMNRRDFLFENSDLCSILDDFIQITIHIDASL